MKTTGDEYRYTKSEKLCRPTYYINRFIYKWKVLVKRYGEDN